MQVDDALAEDSTDGGVALAATSAGCGSGSGSGSGLVAAGSRSRGRSCRSIATLLAALEEVLERIHAALDLGNDLRELALGGIPVAGVVTTLEALDQVDARLDAVDHVVDAERLGGALGHADPESGVARGGVRSGSGSRGRILLAATEFLLELVNALLDSIDDIIKAQGLGRSG